MREQTVELVHGSGGAASWRLVRGLFASRFGSLGLQPENDAALVSLLSPSMLAITTDAFVADPLFFPGGNLGSLAVNGTCNDLAVMGARPLWLTCAFVVAAGTPLLVLERLADAMANAAGPQGVQIVAGDTKVIGGDGHGPQVHIITSGVGTIEAARPWQCHRVLPGDALIITGTIGEHTLAVMGARHGWNMAGIASDCSSLYPLLRGLHEEPGVHFARDVTRGGLVGVCHELAQATGLSVKLDEASIPITTEVAGRCELLGYDPLTLANEGKALLAVAPEVTTDVLAKLRHHSLGRQAEIIGRVHEGSPSPLVTMETAVGGGRVLPPPTGVLFPRIC